MTFKGSGVVGQFAALSDIRSVAVLGGSTIVDEGADVENGGGAVHIGDVGLCHAGTVSGVARPPDGVDDTVAVGSSDISSTDQAAILVEEPGVVLGGVASLIEDELDSIIIDSASNIVLLVVPVDDALSAGEGLGLSDDLAIVISALGASVSDSAADLGIVGRQGVGVQQNVITLDVGVVILAVGEGQFLVGSAIINEEGDAGFLAQVALSIVSGRSNIGDLGEEGVDHDDGIVIDLNQTALSAQLGGGVGQVDRVLSGLNLAVDVQGVQCRQSDRHRERRRTQQQPWCRTRRACR